MCIRNWQNRTPLVSIFCRTWTVKFWEKKPMFQASATENSLFSLFFSVTCRFNLESAFKSMLAWNEDHEIILGVSRCGFSAHSTAIQLWSSPSGLFSSVKVAGPDLVIAKISAISVFFGSNFAWDFPVSVEFPAESSFWSFQILTVART